MGNGRSADAVQRLQEALEIQRRLVAEEPHDLRGKRNLAVTLSMMGDPQLGSADGKLKMLEALGLSRELVPISPGNVKWRTDLAVVLFRLAVNEAGGGNFDTARGHLVEAIGLISNLEAEKTLSADQKGWSKIFTAALAEVQAGRKVTSGREKVWNAF